MNISKLKVANLLALLIIFVKQVNAGRLLVIFTIPFPDNQITFRPLIQNLLDKGHFITLLTTNPDIFLKNSKISHYYNNDCNSNTCNRNDELLEIIDLSFTQNLDVLNNLISSKQQETTNYDGDGDILRDALKISRYIAEKQLHSDEIQHFLLNTSLPIVSTGNDDGHIKKNKIYDAVLVDWSGSSLLNGFAYKFNAPLIGITPAGAYMTIHEAMGNPNHPVLYPSVFMPFSENLSLYEKIVSVVFSYKYRNVYFNEELPVQNQIAKEVFGEDIPDLWELQLNADLLLINNYQILGNVRPVGPTTIYLGGIHAQKTKQQLPADLERFLLNSDNDIVYISLGEPITNAFIQTNRFKKLLKTLEISRFDVIWNMNDHLMTNWNTTDGVYIDAFIPQEIVLAHPKVKLFITIGGQRDIEDAIHHKVPCLGLTFSSTIDHYLLQIEKHGAGLISYFDEDSSTELLTKIEEFGILEKYSANMEKLYNLIQDQPLNSIDRAIWYIEYVMRNNGTKYLKTTWRSISWFHFLLMDVVLTILGTFLVLVVVLAKIIIECRRYSKSLPVEKITKRTLLTKEKMY